MIRLVALLAVAACLAQDLSGPVVRVVDGDTIVVEIAGERERVRYIGVDTPELDDPRPEVRALARAARRANAELVEGRRVRLELDAEKRDRYGRLLAYAWIGDTLVNEALVRRGYAAPYTYPPNVRYAERFVAAARAARDGPAPEPAEAADEAATGPGIPDHAIAAARAVAHVGETATVCDSVASTRHLAGGRRPTFLNLGRPYPRQDLTIVIRGQDRPAFEAAGRPEVRFRDRRVCVSGVVELYRGTPQIAVDDPARLWIAP